MNARSNPILAAGAPLGADIPVLGGIGEIAGRYDGFILDLWGVIHDGRTPYPGVLDTLERLAAAGKPTVMLSNAPRRAAAAVEMMTAMGIPRRLYGAVMTSGEAVNLELRRRTDPWFAALGRRCYHLGAARDLSIFEGLDLLRVATLAEADFILNTGPDSFEVTVADYAPLLDEGLARRLPMVCANPDLVVIHLGRTQFCAGALAEYYAERGGAVRWRGKPDPAIYGACLELLGIAERRRVLAVGDAFRTDVAGAAAAGLDCLLCTGGIHAEEIGSPYGARPDPRRVEAAWAKYGGARPIAAIGGFTW